MPNIPPSSAPSARAQTIAIAAVLSALVTWFGAGHFGGAPECPECPVCPPVESPIAAPQSPALEPTAGEPSAAPSPVAPPLSAPTSASPSAGIGADPASLVGKWRSADGLPLPEAEIVAARPDSKTPYNLSLRLGQDAHIGCGFYASGAAYCKVHDADNRDVPRSVETTLRLEVDGAVLSVVVGDLSSARLIR